MKKATHIKWGLLTLLSIIIITIILYLSIPNITFMSEQKINFLIQGEKVSKSYLSDPFVSNGKFTLINNEGDPVNVSIHTVSLTIGEQQQMIEDVSVFDMNEEQTLDSKKIIITPNSKTALMIGFPRVPIQGTPGSEIFLEVVFTVQEEKIKVISDIELTRRIPL